MAKPAHPEVNTLFTSVGRRVELLQAFHKAYQFLGIMGKVVALDIDPLAPALQVADRYYLVPRLSSPDYVPALVEICDREKIDIVFPLIDPDIPILAQNKAVIQATGAQLAVISPQAVSVAEDKWSTLQLFKRCDLSTPLTWLPEQIDPSQLAYPLFIKPRNGSAAKNTFKISNAEELAFFTKYVPCPMIQEFLPGSEITTDIICDLCGDVLAVVSRKRIEVRTGEVSKGVTIYDQEIMHGCIKIAEALPAIGPITVQCMIKDGKPYFTEINARMGGGLPLSIAAGADAPRWLLARIAGLRVDIPPLGTYKAGLYLTRFDDSYFLTEGQREQMASHHL